MTPTSLVAAGMEAALNRYLSLDPDSAARLTPLEGRLIAMEFEGLGLALYLRTRSGAMEVSDSAGAEPDLRIRGTPLALARLGRDPTGSAGRSGVRLDGDMDLARDFSDLLRRTDIDWEEVLAGAVGDAPAHQLGNAVRGMLGWGRQALDTLLADTAEYLQQESRLLPPAGSVQAFMDEVDTLRSDVDRLEARVRRLRQGLAPEQG